jgi:prepilin-type N-terminal cleavage/methylation domain-containing protein
MKTSSAAAEHTRSRATRRGGFSLIELMVALSIGGVAIGAFYSLGKEVFRVFNQQQQIASTQMGARVAITQLKHDIARAGYLSTPNITIQPGFAPQSCGSINPLIDAPATTGRLAAFSGFQNNVPLLANNDGIDPTGNNAVNGFTADDVVLFGNYETAAEYPGVVRISPNVIGVEQGWHAFRRDFTDWYNSATPVFLPAAFQDAFRVGRLVRVQTTRRLRHFAQIRSLPAMPTPTAPAQIDLDRAIPNNCLNDVDGGWVAPVSAIRYFVANATAANEIDTVNNLPIARLIRLEVDPVSKVAPLDANTVPRVIVDYVVAFNLSFIMSNPTGPGAPDNYVVGQNPAISNPAVVNANPERIRAVRIDLSVRAPQPDPNLVWDPVRCQNLGCFELVAQTPARKGAAARVRSLAVTVFIPNVANEGY